MKAAMRLLVRFHIWFVAIALLSSVLIVAHGYVTGFDPGATTASASFVLRFLAALATVWLPSVLVAVMPALFAIARQSPARGTLWPLFAAWTILIVAGGLLSGLAGPGEPVSGVLPAHRLVRFDGYRVYALDRTEAGTRPFVVHDEAQNPVFAVVTAPPPARLHGELELPGHTRSPVRLDRTANSYPAMVRPPARFERLRSDVVQTARLLAIDGSRTLAVVLNLLALSFYLLGCWTLVRLTRWPLFNAAAVIGALRLALWVIPAVQIGTVRPILVAAFDSRVLPVASAVILAAFGLALLALLVFLPGLEAWRRELGDG